MKHNVVAVYLAAGSSSRMGVQKLTLELEPGRTLGSYALRAALDSGLSAVVVVVRSEGMYAMLTSGLESSRLHQVVSPESAAGMSRSLQSGVAAAEALGAEAAVVLLADQPFVRAADIDALLRAFDAEPALDYAALADQGPAKPPILLARSLFPRVARLEGDEGARRLLRDGRLHGMRLSPSDADCFMDADTPDDWNNIVQHISNKSV